MMHGGRGVRGKAGKFSTNALLQKVNSQLRGEKIPDGQQSDDDDDLNAYLSTISKKKTTPTQPNWEKFGESNLSVSEDDASKHSTLSVKPQPANKFLKKKTVPSEPPKAAQASKYDHSQKKSVSSSQNNALGKVAMLGNKYGTHYEGRQQPGRFNAQLSDSDMDMDLSMDEDVIADVRSWKKQPVLQQKPLQRIPSPAVESEDSSSLNIGKGGSKFLKKAQPSETPKKTQNQSLPVSAPNKKAGGSSLVIKGATGRVVLDTDEESLADFIGGLSGSGSPLTPRTPRDRPKSPHISRDFIGSSRSRSQSNQSLDDINEEEGGYRNNIFMAPHTSEESGDDIKLNIMDFDDLEPAVILEDQKPKQKTKSSRKFMEKDKKATAKNSVDYTDDIFNMMGLQTVDDLMIGSIDQLSVASEIHTAGGISDIRTEPDDSDMDRPPTPLKSILATPRSPKITPRSSRSRVRYKLDHKRSPSPEEIVTAPVSDSTSMINTEEPSIANEISTSRTVPELVETDQSDTESYTQDYSEDFSVQSVPSRQNLRKTVGESDVYSDDFTSATEINEVSRPSYRKYKESIASSYTDEYTSFTDSSRSRTPSPVRRVGRCVDVRSCEVQTGMDMGLMYHWNTGAPSAIMGPQYGMAFVDPTPIATHVVSADALEAVTAFNPSVLALNDMLRQHLTLTTQFLDTQKRLHASYLNMMDHDSYQYTTLEDTKKYIKKHRRPTITFDEALKQVKAEMGLK